MPHYSLQNSFFSKMLYDCLYSWLKRIFFPLKSCLTVISEKILKDFSKTQYNRCMESVVGFKTVHNLLPFLFP